MIEVTAYVNIEVYCKRCGSKLSDLNNSIEDARLILDVDPCGKCLEEAREECKEKEINNGGNLTISPFKFSKRSLDNLNGVNESLVKIVHRALELSDVDFTVVEGVRTKETQAEYVKKGVSQTMNSYHIPNHNGGRAVDLYPYYNGSLQVNATDDKWADIYCAIKQAAKEYGEKITWGGSWKTLVDKPHYQIENK